MKHAQKYADRNAIIPTRVSASQKLPFNARYTTTYSGRRAKDCLDLTTEENFNHDHEGQVLLARGVSYRGRGHGDVGGVCGSCGARGDLGFLPKIGLVF
ncbi:hypothetical protein ES332_A02G155500v1 [Gossypium tomentosum]|uniref:Uncharacterized protein n=1 Tax=Gossypium tomentosum TaxID=34277 RepID=A0A5D2RHT9_GOSTO|nr:hypothetical protein ES332_A02G155500v1 [Gossypium tomentosum]